MVKKKLKTIEMKKSYMKTYADYTMREVDLKVSCSCSLKLPKLELSIN